MPDEEKRYECWGQALTHVSVHVMASCPRDAQVKGAAEIMEQYGVVVEGEVETELA